jgi:predicted CXXCH cytochrome family protein
MTCAGKVLAVVIIAAGFAWLLAGAGAVRGEEKRVAGTAHDIASPDTPACVLCHVQHDPEGQALWPTAPNSTGPLAGLKPLCFSCHDGTVSALRSSYVFDLARPDHPSSPGVKGQDCDRCHDPHYTGYGKFIKLPGGANLCRNCHFRAGPTDHPIDVDAVAAGIIPLDKDWNPSQGDFTGTRLWNAEGTGPGNLVKCLTCHSPHNGQPNTAINTIAFSAADNSYLPLCLNCHPRGGGG